MKKTITILLLLFVVPLMSETTLQIYQKSGSMLNYDMSQVNRLEIGDIEDNFIMKIYAAGEEVGNYPTEEIESMEVTEDGKFIVHSNGSSDEYIAEDIDQVVFVDETTPGPYETVTFGDQIWMAKNLDITKYRNGEEIYHGESDEYWESAAGFELGAWCYYDQDPANGTIYGKLYNCFAVDDPRGLAPEGWHVPSDEEWKELEIYLGMSKEECDNTGGRGEDAGAKLAGGDQWVGGMLKNNEKFGESGFNALPGGFRNGSGGYIGLEHNASFWSAAPNSSTPAWRRMVDYYNLNITRFTCSRVFGFAIRCVKDNELLKVIMTDDQEEKYAVHNIEKITFNGLTDVSDDLLLSNGTQIALYPNPSDGLLNINYTLDKSSAGQLEIYTIAGTKLLTTDIGLQSAGEHTYQLNIESLPQGAYRLILKTENAHYPAMFIKIK